MLMPPGHQYTREELEHLKRSEIQKLCKDYGLRANMKTETLVDELLETIRSNIAPLVPPPQAPQHSGPVTRRASARSRTSSRSTTIRTRGSSGSSFATTEPAETLVGTADGTWSGTDSLTSHNTAATASRTRKAKDTQFRLGVGRPTAAGGSGARSVTRSASKNRRNRLSRGAKPIQETIEEEQETEQAAHAASVAQMDPALLYPQMMSAETPQPIMEQHPIIAQPTPQHHTPPQILQQPNPSMHFPESEVLSRVANLESTIQTLEIPQHQEILRTVVNEFEWLKQVVQNQHMEINSMKSDVQSCRLELQALRNDSNKILFLENQISALKDNMAFFRTQFGASAPGTPGLKAGLQSSRRVSIPLGESNTNTSTPQRPATSSNPSNENLAPMVAFTPASHPVTPPPSRPVVTAAPPNTLGKRHRNSTSSELADALEETDSDGNLARRVLRPNKKRAKLSEQESSEDHGVAETASASSGPSTLPSVGTPPPTAHLPDYFAASADCTQEVAGEDDAAGNRGGPFRGEGFYPFSFTPGLASSTPRGESHSAFGADFSLGSAVKTTPQRVPSGAGLAPQAFSMRRVSSLAARPRTPARMTGQDRFKNSTPSHVANTSNGAAAAVNSNSASVSPQRQQQQQHETPTMAFSDSFGFQIDDDAYGIEFQPNRESASQMNPMSMSLHFGIGFGVPMDEGGSSPVQPPPRTMYGTELANDTRFGDFGRDGIASMSGRNSYWW